MYVGRISMPESVRRCFFGHAAQVRPGSRAGVQWRGVQCGAVRHAELVVLGDDDVGRVDRAGRAARVTQHLVGAERLLERVVGEQPAGERVAETEDQLDRLERLDRADDAGQHAEHTGLGARRRQLGGRRLGDHAAVARPDVRVEDRGLALEAEDRAVHDGDLLDQRRVVEQVARSGSCRRRRRSRRSRR